MRRHVVIVIAALVGDSPPRAKDERAGRGGGPAAAAGVAAAAAPAVADRRPTHGRSGCRCSARSISRARCSRPTGQDQQRGRRHRPRSPRAARHRGRAGDVLVRLEPRELQLALDRAESALRQVEAQLGIDRGAGQAAAGRRADRVGAPGDGQSRRCAQRLRARAAAERPRPADAGRPRHRGDAAQGARSELSGGARHRPQPEGEPAGSPRLLRAGAEESWPTRSSGRRSPARCPSGWCSPASTSARTRRSRPSCR